jgi:uncharacterized protein YjhX (UPF0386 family)
MKILRFLIVSILTVSSALASIKRQEIALNERSFLIKNPTYPGTEFLLGFDEWGKEDGVCKLLGYEKAVSRSTLFGGLHRAILIDKNGEIENLKNDTNAIIEIICINETKTYDYEQLVEIQNPTYPGTEFPLSFDVWGKEDGVCKLLGYEKAVSRSAFFKGDFPRVIFLNENGDIEKSKGNVSKIQKIICMNERKFTALRLTVEENPTHPNSNLPVMIDDWNKESGICKLLGHRKAVPRSSLLGGGPFQRVILLDANGKIEKLQNNINRVISIICIE